MANLEPSARARDLELRSAESTSDELAIEQTDRQADSSDDDDDDEISDSD